MNVPTAVTSVREERVCDTSVVSLENQDESIKYPQKTEIVLRVNTSTSDAASQTDLEVSMLARAEPATGVLDSSLDESSSDSSRNDIGHFSIVRQKSQEEIDCEALTRELVSHLSVNDHLYRILGEWASEFFEYVSHDFVLYAFFK